MKRTSGGGDMSRMPSADEICEMVMGMSVEELNELWERHEIQHVIGTYIKRAKRGL